MSSIARPTTPRRDERPTAAVSAALPRLSMRDLAVPKLEGLAAGLGLSSVVKDAVSVLDLLTGEWTREPAGGTPLWSSDITDDGTPFEFSVAFNAKGPELRLLAEPRGARTTAQSFWEAGLALNERLRDQYDVDLSRFDRIAHLFAPLPSIPCQFSLWHAAVIGSDGAPSFKIYSNPQVVGRAGSRGLVARALKDLRLSHAERFLVDFVPQGFEALYFSLDLKAGLDARTKVYVADPTATAQSIDGLLHRAGLTRSGEVTGWVENLTRRNKPHDQRTIQLCFAFRDNESSPEVTVHVPVRSYTETDGQALGLACRFLDEHNRRLLTRGVEQMAQRSLESGRSLITYVSLRPRGRSLGVTVYLSPELYAIAAPRVSVPPAQSLIRELAKRPRSESRKGTFHHVLQAIGQHRADLERHPFFERLATAESSAGAREIARRGAFFVLGFQDVLKLVTELTSEPDLRESARHHEAEDKGHDNWYLHDLSQLGVTCKLEDVFSDDLRQARLTIYNLMADVIRSTDDRSRLAVVLALEAAGSVYFEAIIAFLERIGQSRGLLYFARSHQHVESSHEIFEADKRERLERLAISPAGFEEALSVVERTFRTMADLGNDFLRHLDEHATPRDLAS